MKSTTALAKFADELRRRKRARKTIESYVGVAERYVEFAAGSKDSPEDAISNFLGSICRCTVSTQKHALSALAGENGFYACLGREIGELPRWCYAKRPERIPVWTTQSEAEAIIAHLKEPWSLVAGLMFGSGLRIGETISLRWRCFDFERGTVSIWGGKGDKCRIAPLSRRLVEPLLAQRHRCRALYDADRAAQRPGVAPVEARALKYPNHGKDWPFFWVFPSANESRDPESGIVRRHHMHDKSFGKALRPAKRAAGVDKPITAHSFRHGFATAYLLAGGNLRELQERLGHTDIGTTMRYLHCLPQDHDRIGSPWDCPSPDAPPIIQFRKPQPALQAL